MFWGEDGVGAEHALLMSVQRRAGELGGRVDIAAQCAGGLFHLDGVAHRDVLRTARPAPRGVGPDRPERSAGHRGWGGPQPARPYDALAAAGLREPVLRHWPGQLPGPDRDHEGDGSVSVLRGRFLPGAVSADRGRVARFYLVAHPGPGPAQP